MKRFVKTAAMSAASCALVVGGAGIANAGGVAAAGDSHHGKNGHHGRSMHQHGYLGYQGQDKVKHHGAKAIGKASKTKGFISGNVIQVPVNVPINLCGNTINVIALLNPAFGNICIQK
ncbi:chaplin protein [Streptomyces sp. NBRC 110611]|uniref:chaplin n=1 Tax=Streptomyces sp. NBRC 110611 TaxID=1621259 RepID=UPI0008373B18|nr:chaplin [Streptomyces sp. NBRC 110611]GAU68058.1 chaplin protein [Streptomyces sp. NBRC 110611]